MHGSGKIVFKDGFSYEGEWVNGQREGEGVARYTTVYEGAFVNGQHEGIGTIRTPDGYTYTGEWKAGEIVDDGASFLGLLPMHFPGFARAWEDWSGSALNQPEESPGPRACVQWHPYRAAMPPVAPDVA